MLVVCQGLHIDSFKLPASCSCHVSHVSPHSSPRSPIISVCSDNKIVFRYESPVTPLYHPTPPPAPVLSSSPAHVPVFSTVAPQHVPGKDHSMGLSNQKAAEAG